MGLGDFVKRIFLKDDSTVQVELTRDQLVNIQGLVEKERRELAKKMHDTVDKGSLEGKTISIRKLFASAYNDSMSPSDRETTDNQLQSMLDRYGEEMPANTAHRISQEIEYGVSVWSENPACYERYLRNRDGSIFYSALRRVVTIDEIWEAQEKDKALIDGFNVKFYALTARMKSAGAECKADQATQLLQDTQMLLDDLASIAGPLSDKYSILISLEETLIQMLSKALPEQAEGFEEIRNESLLLRIPFLAQMTCDHQPIPNEDVLPAMLSDGIKTVSLIGTATRILKISRPNDTDVRQALDEAVSRGLRKELAGQMLSAWAGYDS